MLTSLVESILPTWNWFCKPPFENQHVSNQIGMTRYEFKNKILKCYPSGHSTKKKKAQVIT